MNAAGKSAGKFPAMKNNRMTIIISKREFPAKNQKFQKRKLKNAPCRSIIKHQQTTINPSNNNVSSTNRANFIMNMKLQNPRSLSLWHGFTWLKAHDTHSKRIYKKHLIILERKGFDTWPNLEHRTGIVVISLCFVETDALWSSWRWMEECIWFKNAWNGCTRVLPLKELEENSCAKELTVVRWWWKQAQSGGWMLF